MFGFGEKKPDVTAEEILRIQEERMCCSPDSNRYAILNARLKELYELQAMEKPKGFEISGDTIVKCACYILIGGLVVFREELVGPVTSKALGLISKIV